MILRSDMIPSRRSTGTASTTVAGAFGRAVAALTAAARKAARMIDWLKMSRRAHWRNVALALREAAPATAQTAFIAPSMGCRRGSKGRASACRMGPRADANSDVARSDAHQPRRHGAWTWAEDRQCSFRGHLPIEIDQSCASGAQWQVGADQPRRLHTTRGSRLGDLG